MARDEGWFSDFWDALPDMDDDADTAITAVRLIGEMFDEGLFWRDGDDLVGRDGSRLPLDASDQYFIRRIENASGQASLADESDSAPR